MGNENLFKKTGRKSATEQFKEIGAAVTSIFGADDEKPSGYKKVIDKDPIKDKAKKNVKSSKSYKKVTKTTRIPHKQKSSKKNVSFLDMFTS